MPLPLRLPPTTRERAAASQSGRHLRRLIDRAHPPGPERRLVAVLSDLHLHAPRPYDRIPDFYLDAVDANAQAELALTAAVAAQPGLVLLGGDLADSIVDGRAPLDEYQPLRAMLRRLVPRRMTVLAIPGNHDHAHGELPAASATALAGIRPGHPTTVVPDGFSWCAAWSGWRIVGLDTRDGRLTAAQHAWLDDALQSNDAPILLALHRPVLPCGNWVDNHRLADPAVVDRLLACPRLRLIVSGHTHRPRAWRYGGQTHLIAPSTAYGIGAALGWNLVVLRGDRVEAIYLAGLPRRTQDHPTRRWLPGACRITRLATPEVTRHPLFDPCVLPVPAGGGA